MERAKDEERHHHVEEEALHHAERAGLQPFRVLQVIGVAEESDANDRAGREGHARMTKDAGHDRPATMRAAASPKPIVA